jgi:hypothetical protein
MKKLLIAIALNCATIAPICANVFPVAECKILLEKDDYITHKGNIFIKEDVENEIFESVKAWQMLEFKVFIYVSCDYCGQAHLVDHACNSEMCKNRVR